MLYRLKQYSFTDPDCSDGDTFEQCNLSQLVPGTEICEGKIGLTFRQCNLVNCLVPVGSIIERCNTTQVSRCSHLHPEWVERGLAECAVDCSHVIEVETVEVAGVPSDMIYTREDEVL